MEGRIFACSWKREGRKYRVWVKRRPKLFAIGTTFGAADRALWTVIMDATGDGENDRRYDPPEPETSENLLQPKPPSADVTTARVTAARKALEARPKRDRKKDPLRTTADIERRFTERVTEHFGLLVELGLKGPKISMQQNDIAGTWFVARFASTRRAVEISLDLASQGHPNGTAFEIDAVPAGEPLARFMSVAWLGRNRNPLGNILAEFELHAWLDECMLFSFPRYAEFMREELRPLITGDAWHDDYELYEE